MEEQGYVEKRELQQFVLKPGRCADLIRNIYNATLRGGEITIKFEGGKALEETIVLWKKIE